MSYKWHFNSPQQNILIICLFIHFFILTYSGNVMQNWITYIFSYRIMHDFYIKEGHLFLCIYFQIHVHLFVTGVENLIKAIDSKKVSGTLENLIITNSCVWFFNIYMYILCRKHVWILAVFVNKIWHYYIANFYHIHVSFVLLSVIKLIINYFVFKLITHNFYGCVSHTT